jgi:peroxiredoxin
VLFDPGCSHCQNETKGLAKNYDKIKDINVLYVSMNDPALMAQFFTTFGKELEGKENVQMLWDRNQEFVQKFHIPNMFPANYVYGPDGQLKSYWEGEKDINEVIAEFKK